MGGIGWGPQWDIPNNDIDSASHAVLERVFFVKKSGEFQRAPKPWDLEKSRGVEKPIVSARERVRSKTEAFCKAVGGQARSFGKKLPLSPEQFVGYYCGAKRKCYEKAAESLLTEPLGIKDCRVKLFTKDEYRKPGGAPRAIQPRSPRYNVQLGRHIKHVEHSVFEAIDNVFADASGYSRKTIAKGMNMLERGENIEEMWESFENPVAVGLDASRFDQHINRLLLEREHDIIEMFCHGEARPGLESLRTLLRQQLRNCGRYYGKGGTIKYKTDGCRMSGDMNTSLGNVIVMTMLFYTYLCEKSLINKVLLLNDGDDCVVVMDERDLFSFRGGLETWFLEFGLTMKEEGLFHTLEEIEFCQSHPVQIGGRCQLVPNPNKRIFSDLVTTKPVDSKKVYNKMLGAIAGCGLASSCGVPIFQEYYSWLARERQVWQPREGSYYYRYRDTLSKGIDQRSEVTDEARVSFYFAYGLTPDEQVLIEEHFRQEVSLRHSKPINVDPRLERYPPALKLLNPVQKPYC